jgi:hypothetical protein
MKKFLLSSLLISFVIIAAGSNDVIRTYRFSQPEISSTDGFHQVAFDDMMLTGVPGEPMLPYQSVALLLPPGHVADNIELTFGAEIHLEGYHKIYPMQYSQPLSKGGSGIFAFKEDVYKTNAFYPEQMQGDLVTHFINGYAVAMTTFTPVRYNPATGQLSYFKEITIKLTTKPDEKANAALKNIHSSSPVMQRLGMTVQNPKMIAEYPQRESKSDDYHLLIITPSQFESDFEQLADFYTPRGIIAQIATTQFIYSTMPGQDNQEKIRNFIIQEYQDHGIQHVTLAGDVEHIPYRGFYCTVQSSSVYTDDDIPSDLYYSALDGTWNDNGNNLWGEIGEDDLLPEIGIARFTFSTQADLDAMMNKTLSYQDTPVLGELQHPLLAGEHLYSNPTTWGADFLELLIGYQNENGYETTGIPENHPYEELYDRNQTWSATTLRQKINQGKSFVHHSGHASSTYSMRLYNSDISNGNFSQVNGVTHNFTLVYSHGCNSGSFDSDDCIAERMVNIQNFAVAVVMNSRYGWFNEGQTEGPSAHLHREFVDALYNQKEPHIGMTHTISRIKTAPWVTAPGQWEEGALRWCFYCCNVFGDAALRIWSDEPVNITATYQNALPIGVPDISMNISGDGPVEGLVCTFIKDDVVYGIGETDATGNVQIEFTQTITELGEATIFVSGYNCLLNEFPVLVIPNEGAYVVYDSSEINDEQGNNNGLPDYNESILLTTTLKNVGTAQAANVTATLLSSDPYVTITTATADFGSIPGEGAITVEDAFAFDIAGNIPDQHPVAFSIEASGQEVWSSGFSVIANAPKLTKQDFIINDAVGGNNNGMLDPGETADMVITVENSGHAEAFSVTAVLTSGDPYISVNTTTTQNLGNLDAGQTIPATFSLTADEDTPAGYTAELDLTLEALHGIVAEHTIQLNFTDYCYPTANCEWGDGLSGFSMEEISNMNNGCSDDGYGDFTDMSTDIEPGQTYNVSLETDYSNQLVSLWIDFNSNKEFEPGERLLTDFNLENSNQVYTTQITIPESVTGGIKRLRVRANWQNSSADPCENFTYGETEDYTVVLPAGTLGVTVWCDPDEICQYDSTQLMAVANGGSGNYTYAWTPETGLSDPTIQNPMASPEETTTYTVEVSDGYDVVIQQLIVQVNPLPPTPTISLEGNTLYSDAPEGNQWYDTNGPIPGADGQSYECTWEDIYHVKVTGSEGCVSLPSNSIHVIITSVDEFNASNGLTLYPNPFADKVFIEFEKAAGEHYHLAVYNAVGQEIQVISEGFSNHTSIKKLEISTENFENGIYYFKLITEKKIIVTKLIRAK